MGKGDLRGAQRRIEAADAAGAGEPRGLQQHAAGDRQSSHNSARLDQTSARKDLYCQSATSRAFDDKGLSQKVSKKFGQTYLGKRTSAKNLQNVTVVTEALQLALARLGR
jgi:hypothetical protein